MTTSVMPGALQGPDLAEAARRVKPEVTILFMSGYPKEGGNGSAQLPGGAVLLQKPLSKDLLLDAVRTALGE